MRYVGIDPASKTGLVIVDENNNVYNATEITARSKEDPHRFMEIADLIMDELQPNDMIAIEGFSYGSKGKGVSFQYGLGWMIRSRLVERDYKYLEFAPTSVKKFATGKGNIKKDEMVLPIYKKYGFESHSDNIRDAYVLAQMVRALKGEGELTKYQEEALKKVVG